MSKFWADSDSSSSSSRDDSDCDREDDVNDGTSSWGEICASRGSGVREMTSATMEDSDLPDEVWRRIASSQVFLPVPTTTTTTTTTTTSPLEPACIRIVCMSDTHGRHRDIAIPNGNILIHGGDFTKSGEIGTVQDLSRMFSDLQSRFDDIVCIAGNHEVIFEGDHYKLAWQDFHRKPISTTDAREALQNCIYLENDTCVIRDMLVYGSPCTPEYGSWGFCLPRGDPLRQEWNKIPTDTDILITHGPPLGHGDREMRHGNRVGCVDLLQHVQTRVKPRLHIFGHVHEGYGCSFDGSTLFVNASNLNFRYQPINQCIVIDLPIDRTKTPRVVQPRCRINTHSEFLEWMKAQQGNYPSLLAICLEQDLEGMPVGDRLISEDAYNEVVAKLNLYRTRDACNELRLALNQIYAESFD